MFHTVYTKLLTEPTRTIALIISSSVVTMLVTTFIFYIFLINTTACPEVPESLCDTNIEVTETQKEVADTLQDTPESIDISEEIQEIEPSTTKKVLVAYYDPVITNTTSLSKSFPNWHSPEKLTDEIVHYFDELAQQDLKYEVVEEVYLAKFPIKEDGFRYTAESYIHCFENRETCHQRDVVDYTNIVRELDACQKLNAGEINELWIWGGPYFGYWESTLAGPNSFWFNSQPIPFTECESLLPIMGFNYERGLESAIHNWGHRIESTMTKVYGTWSQNSTSHNWNRFGLNAAQSPNFQISGCGSIHYPPNGTKDYDYANSAVARTYCDEFLTYGTTNTDTTKSRPITCSEWGCNELGFLRWWMNHIPRNQDTNQDGKYNNWWIYISDVNLVPILDI